MTNNEIIAFARAHPELVGLASPAFGVLMKEKDATIRQKAIEVAANELKKRQDVNSPAFCLVRRNVTENQIRKIIQGLKPSSSKKNETPKEDTRSEVVSFRTTVGVDGAITFLANECDASKSFVIDVLIKIQRRFGFRLK